MWVWRWSILARGAGSALTKKDEGLAKVVCGGNGITAKESALILTTISVRSSWSGSSARRPWNRLGLTGLNPRHRRLQSPG